VSLPRRFGVRPATFVALGSLFVGMVLVDRKMAELEDRLDELSIRARSTSLRLDVADDEAATSVPASSGTTVPTLEGDVGTVGFHEEPAPLPQQWERRWPFGSGLRPAFRSTA
jgi:hypothetical protein